MTVITSTSALIEIESALTTIVRRANLPRLQERILKDAGLEMDRAAYPLLRRLAELAPARITTLAHAMNIDVSTVSRQVKQLEALGFVKRALDSSDARVSIVSLTSRGVRAMKQVGRARRSMFETILADWPDDERDALAKLLGHLATGIVEFEEVRG